MTRAARALAYAWASPVTAIGLLFVALALATRGRVARVAGALEAHGGALPLLLRLAPVRGGAAAVALGHVVLARTASDHTRWRAHERVHVRQAERWGPLFLPAYLGAAAWAWLRGRDPYAANPFEREAYARASDTVPPATTAGQSPLSRGEAA